MTQAIGHDKISNSDYYFDPGGQKRKSYELIKSFLLSIYV
jgi:hypothetical protein